jgi:hypothetical protein
MYKINYRLKGEKATLEAETLNEALSMCVDLFGKNADTFEITKDEEIIYKPCQIYKLIGKAIY